MEPGAFRPPLGLLELAALGRATYNWGMADMLAGSLLVSITQTKAEMVRELITPLMIEKKAQILKRNLALFPEGECQSLVEEFVKIIIKVNSGRNHAIHGFWGWHRDDDSEEFAAAAYSHKSSAPLLASEIDAVADQIAVATRKAHGAFMILMGVDGGVEYPVNFFFGNRLPEGQYVSPSPQPDTESP
jgi:hypothetical protein